MSVGIVSVQRPISSAVQVKELTAVGRKPSDNYDYGEPGKWGEDPELIDFVEGDEGDDDD